MSGGQTPGKRLNITEKGKLELDELMTSKDKMAQYAQRPFRSKQAGGTLNFGEFVAALRGILEEVQISAPSEPQMRLLFDKHQRDGRGLGVEEYEALLFRLLSFMRASQEVSLTPKGGTARPSGEERDKRWREEFIVRNPRRFRDVYDVLHELGKGTFGTVYKIAHKTQRSKKNEKCIRVCKIVSKAMAEKAGTTHAKVREELAVLKQLDHPHVLRIFEDFEDDLNFYLIMEPCWGGDLQDYVKTLDMMDKHSYEKWVAKVMQHTLSAIAYCHEKGVIHKDLKPENVMVSTAKDKPVSEMHVVIVDFGLSEVFTHPTDRSNIVSGTPPYMAPEVWAGNFNKACDLWSCGVMLFFLLSGRLPFMAQRVEDFPGQVNNVEPDWAKMGGASPEAHTLCRKMLAKRWDMRPSAQNALKERWFMSCGLAAEATTPQIARFQLDALMKVNQRSEFEKFVTRLVATQVDTSKFKDVNEAFAAFDIDGDGQLSRDELRQGLMRLNAPTDDVDLLFEELDVGQTGRISYTEFLAGVINLRGKKTEEQDRFLWIAWQQFSPDENGRVTTAAVQDALAARGMTVADLPEKFLQQLSRDAAGYMTFDSFKRLFGAESSTSVFENIADRGKTRGARFLRWLMKK